MKYQESSIKFQNTKDQNFKDKKAFKMNYQLILNADFMAKKLTYYEEVEFQKQEQSLNKKKDDINWKAEHFDLLKFKGSKNFNFSSYLERLIKFGLFNPEVYLTAYNFFSKAINSLKNIIGTDTDPYKIKIMSVCLYISQKLLLDRSMSLDDYCLLVGFPQKTLKTSEILVMDKLLCYNISINYDSMIDYWKNLITYGNSEIKTHL